jgi:hypothetical protein
MFSLSGWLGPLLCYPVQYWHNIYNIVWQRMQGATQQQNLLSTTVITGAKTSIERMLHILYRSLKYLISCGQNDTQILKMTKLQKGAKV